MKSLLVTAVSALALGLILNSIAAAQKLQPPSEPTQAAPTSPSQSSILSVAEAKKRYRATQEHLQNLVKDPGTETIEIPFMRGGRPVTEIQGPRDRIRAAVAADFDARRQLQQGELAELEGRVARIKRALEIRDAMRDTIIDQRTDELLDEMEEAGSSGTRGGPAAPDGVRPGNNPGAEKGAATPPAESDAAVKEQAHILKRQLDEAKANLESAEHAKERALRLFRSGAISQDAVVEEAQKVKPARILFDRLVLQWDAFLEAHPDLPKTKAPAARDGAPNGPTKPSTERGANPRTESDADASRHKSRLLELDADEAIANFESAERDFRRLEKLRASGAIEQAVLDEQVEKLALARIKLERAAQKWALDVEEAQANLGSAERAYKRAEKLHASGAIEQSVLDEQADKYNRAQIELNRAESKIHTTFDRVEQRLKALDQPLGLPVEQPAKQAPTGAGALDEPTKTSSEQAPVDDSINSLP